MKALEVSQRPKNSGLGACQADLVMRQKKQINKEAETGVKEEEAAEEKKGPQPKMWKKRNKEKREKREYKTAEELLRESEVRLNAHCPPRAGLQVNSRTHVPQKRTGLISPFTNPVFDF
jgi:hypothetical protein